MGPGTGYLVYGTESAAWLLRHHIDWDEPVTADARLSGGNRVIAPA